MKKVYLVVIAFLALSLLAGACSPPATPVPPTDVPTLAPSATPSANGTVVNVGKNDKLGPMLVDVKGLALYLYTEDTPNTSHCYGECHSYWPPLLTTDPPVAGAGVDASKLGTTMRTDGAIQVTYNGWPLYYFYADRKPGSIQGLGFLKVWYLISPEGDQIDIDM